jgi:hypothetical protein
MQLPLQYAQPGWHLLHDPWLQNGVVPPQTIPQPPQLFGSHDTGVHAPLQTMAP